MVDGVCSVYIEVGEFERSLAFYRALLGDEVCQIPFSGDGVDRGAFFELPDGARVIVAYQRGRTIAPNVGMSVEFQVGDPAAEVERLRAAGVEATKDVIRTDGGSLAFVVTDPDGRELRVGTRWPLDAS